jgi:hypothetical protein
VYVHQQDTVTPVPDPLTGNHWVGWRRRNPSGKCFMQWRRLSTTTSSTLGGPKVAEICADAPLPVWLSDQREAVGSIESIAADPMNVCIAYGNQGHAEMIYKCITPACVALVWFQAAPPLELF